MKSYEILRTKLYDSIIISLLKRNIISLEEAFGCFNDIAKDSYSGKDLIKETNMVQPKGLTNLTFGDVATKEVEHE